MSPRLCRGRSADSGGLMMVHIDIAKLQLHRAFQIVKDATMWLW